MNGIHRNALIGHLVWGGLAALCLVLFMVAREQERAALGEQVSDAERRAILYADTVLYHGLPASAVSAPLTGETYREVLAVIENQMLDDARVARVRLWAPDGTLTFSTAEDERGKIRRLRVNEDPAITAAAAGAVASRLATVRFASSATDDPAGETELFETFLPLRVEGRTDVLGAVEIDQYYEALTSTTAIDPTTTVRWGYLGLAALFVVLTALSFRPRRPSEVEAGWTRASTTSGAATAEESGPSEELARRNEEFARRNEELEVTIGALRAELAAATTAVQEAERAAVDARDEVAALVASATDAHPAEADRLADAERRASEAVDRAEQLEVLLATARREVEEAAAGALEPRAAPSDTTASLNAQALELLEARVMAAEDRAAEAERRLAEIGLEGPTYGSNGHPEPVTNGERVTEAEADVPMGIDPGELHAPEEHPEDDGEPDGSSVFPISPEASDLRARLARSAALKKRSIEG